MSLENYSLEELQGIINLNEAMLRNPETRDSFLRLGQKITGTQVPEISQRDTLQSELAKEREERLKLQAKIEKDALVSELGKKKSAAQAKFKLTDEQMDAVQQLMVDKSIPDFETAADYYSLSQQQSAPTVGGVFTNPGIEMPSLDIWKQGIGNKNKLNQIARKIAYDTWNEIS